MPKVEQSFKILKFLIEDKVNRDNKFNFDV